MAHISKAILAGQIYLTAIMTLIAGMPHFVCRCPGKVVDSPPEVQTASCCCCSSCGSARGQEKSIGKRSCCSQTSAPGKNKETTRSHQATGSDCTKVTGLPKVPAVSATKSAKLFDVSSSAWTASVTFIYLSLQIGPRDSVGRWTGHSPAPPTDRVISLQRLLI
jgi:hypothetical protein